MIHPAGPKRVTANTHMAKTDVCKKVHKKININAYLIDSMLFKIVHILRHCITAPKPALSSATG